MTTLAYRLEAGLEQPVQEQSPELSFSYENVTAETIKFVRDETAKRCYELIDQVIFSTDLSYEAILAPVNEINDSAALLNGYLDVLCYLHPDAEIRETAAHFADFYPDHPNYGGFYKKVTAYSKTEDAHNLPEERSRYLQTVMREFFLDGHGLNRRHRKKLKKMYTNLSNYKADYCRNLTEDQTAVELTEDELDGMPDEYKSNIPFDTENNCFLVPLDDHLFEALMSHVSNRDVRARLHKAYYSRVAESNKSLLRSAEVMRQKMAGRLGYSSWMHLRAEENMLKSPQAVRDFYQSLIDLLTPKAQEEMAVMTEMLVIDGHEPPFQHYDFRYYETKLYEREFGLDPHKIAEYFPLEVVIENLFDTTRELGVQYRPIAATTWHEDVITIAVDDIQTGRQVATIHLDPYTRKGKWKVSYATQLVSGRVLPDGSYRMPVALISTNFKKPSADRPCLLTQKDREAEGFHEFGHNLPNILAQTELVNFADGGSVEQDFLEVASQLMEHWAWDREGLVKYTRHYKTGERMPDEMIDRLIASRNLNIGLHWLRDTSKGLFDIALNSPSKGPKDVDRLWEEASAVSLFPPVEGTFLPGVVDSFITEYAGSYHSYDLGRVISDDLFSQFPANPNAGMDYRTNILQFGGSKRGIEMVRNFLGRDPNGLAFLRNIGVTATAESIKLNFDYSDWGTETARK